MAHELLNHENANNLPPPVRDAHWSKQPREQLSVKQFFISETQPQTQSLSSELVSGW
jgi:hypothetical protein